MATQTSLYREVLQGRQDLFNKALAEGIHTPFLFPWDTLPVWYLAIGVLLTPQFPPTLARLCRISLFLISCTHMVLRWPYVRTVGLTAGYGIGLSGFWGLVMTLILLVLHDPGKDFKRIEVRKSVNQQPPSQPSHSPIAKGEENGTLRRRKLDTDAQHTITSSTPNGDKNAGGVKFVWQDFPTDFWHRLDWSIDLMTTFRGINWNFRVPIKTYVVSPPEGDCLEQPKNAMPGDQKALKQLQRSAIVHFLLYYLVLDVLKTFMVTDPYWLGIAPLDSPTPWAWLANLEHMVPGAIHFVRLSVSLTAVVSALTLIFSLSPLFFATVLPYLFNGKVYDITRSPLLEVWMYPPQWGSMFSTLCNKGLAGMWATWWHQMFRYGISEPSKLLMRQLNIAPRSQIARALQLFIAFGLTAGIHAAASSTTFSIIPGKPRHPFIFFIGQALGILVQTEVSRILNNLINFPRIVRQTGNFGFVFIFMWYIGPYLADDFARCQIWLFEPVPISFLRGFGFGPGDCWIPWLSFSKGGRWLGWWNGGNWYNSGIGIY